MKVLIFLALVAIASAQLGNIGNIIGKFLGWSSENYKGYHFEYHHSHNLLLVRSSHGCWLISGTKDLESKFDNKQTREQLEHEIYAQIQSHTGETKESMSDLRNDYHDIRALAECFRHSVYELTYTPSS